MFEVQLSVMADESLDCLLPARNRKGRGWINASLSSRTGSFNVRFELGSLTIRQTLEECRQQTMKRSRRRRHIRRVWLGVNDVRHFRVSGRKHPRGLRCPCRLAATGCGGNQCKAPVYQRSPRDAPSPMTHDDFLALRMKRVNPRRNPPRRQCFLSLFQRPRQFSYFAAPVACAFASGIHFSMSAIRVSSNGWVRRNHGTSPPFCLLKSAKRFQKFTASAGS